MVKVDSIQQSIIEIEAIGQENAELMPQVENWCIHLNVQGFARGMVAEMKGLANNVSLTCQHAVIPSQWYRISFVAEEFIGRNCLHCSFHKARYEPNYGQVIVAKLKKLDDEKLENERVKIDLAEKVKRETNTLIDKGIGNANPTQLSILKMVAKLTDDAERNTVAAQLSAAAQLDPAFFSDASLDVLFMYFDNENGGGDCIDAACSVMAHRNYFPVKAFELAKEQIKTSSHFDLLAKILAFYINGSNITENVATLDALIDRLWYKRSIGEPADPVRNFQNCESLLVNLGKTAREQLTGIFKKHLAINEKYKRININLLLQKLAAGLPDMLPNLIKEVIKSLEFVDDQYEQSADKITLDTLDTIVKAYPSKTLEILEDEKARLSIEAQATLLGLNIQLLGDRFFSDHHPLITEKLVSDLVARILNKNIPEKIREIATHDLSFFIDDRPELFQAHFDGFLGYLSQVAEEDALFKYYKDELENKKPNEYTTFNYLVGKNFWDISGIEQQIQTRYREIKKILGALCKAAPQQNLPKVYSLIPEIDSVKNEKYKQELISIVMDYVKDPVTIVGFVPQLYRHLLDPDSMNIRYIAFKFLDLLLDRFPMLITSSLWDLFDVFIKDKEVVVKGMALTMLGTIARKYPERVLDEYLKIHKEALVNSRVFIHSHAISIADDLHRFMDNNQRYEMTGLLLQLADAYSKEENDSTFSSIVDQLLYFVSEQPKVIYKIAVRYIIPKTETEEYYKAKEQIEKLERIAKNIPDVAELWLSSVLSFLVRFPYNGGGQDDRLNFYFDMYHIDRKVIIGQQEKFRELLRLPGTSMQTHFDIAHTLDVLGYFECYELINEMSIIIKSQYSDVEANKRLLRFVDFWNLLAASEIASDKLEKANSLKAAENVF